MKNVISIFCLMLFCSFGFSQDNLSREAFNIGKENEKRIAKVEDNLKDLYARLEKLEKNKNCPCGDNCKCVAPTTASQDKKVQKDDVRYLYSGDAMEPGVKYTLHPSSHINLPNWDGVSPVTQKEIQDGFVQVEQVVQRADGSRYTRIVTRPQTQSVSMPTTVGADNHTHTCPSCRITWGGVGHSHNCPQCGRSVTLQDGPWNNHAPTQTYPVQQVPQFYTLPSYSGGCINGSCGWR